MIPSESIFEESSIGRYNAMIINNLIVNIVENSFGKDCIMMDESHFNALKKAKKDNYELIYLAGDTTDKYNTLIRPMFSRLYEKILDELALKHTDSPVFRHHIETVERTNRFNESCNYRSEEPNMIAVDFIASMTDDYFIDLYEYYFGASGIEYISYFDC